MREGKTLFLFDEDKLPGRELTKLPPALTDFKLSGEQMEKAEAIIYVQLGGRSHLLKNRYGDQGFVIKLDRR